MALMEHRSPVAYVQLLVTAANKCTMKNLTVQELFAVRARDFLVYILDGLPGVAQAIYEMRVDADMLNFKPTNVAALLTQYMQ